MFRRKKESSGVVRVFFATDIHGSETCFRKWLNAARVYEAQILVLGGDVTGKVVVPLVVQSDGCYACDLFGEQVVARDEDELEVLQRRIRKMGRYDVLMTADDKSRLDGDSRELDRIFHTSMAASLERWVALADERLDGTEVSAFMMLGNDDFPDLADVLRGGKAVRYAEGEVFDLPGGFQLASFGFSTPTPWNTPRELSEEGMATALASLLGGVSHSAEVIFNIHCPPRDTHLDQAPRLDANLRPVMSGGGVELVPVGSQAVRDALAERQPILGLHGHVHESAGVERLGTTLCINPGSDYADGILRGVIVDLAAGEGIRRWQMVQG